MQNTQKSGLTYLFKNRRLFAISILLGGILGVSITFFIPKKFLSTAIIYPYNSHTRGDIVANPQFGYEVETEQLLQLLESKSMRDRTINAFELYDHYGLDTMQKSWKTELALKYISEVSFFRSKYLSVVINVEMEDPELAAKVANYQVAEVNNYRESIFEENRKMEYDAIQDEYEKCEKGIEQLKDSIYAVNSGNDLLYNFIENLNNENYDPSGFVTNPVMEELVERYVYEMNRFKALRVKRDDMKKSIEEPLPSVYSIDEAVPSYKKVSPSFTVNGLIGAALVFFVSLTMRLIIDKWKQLRSENP